MVAQNAVKHGLLAQEVVIKGEDPGALELYRDQRLEELDPVGPMEAMLAARVVRLSWRLQRAERIQSAAFEALEEKKQTPALPVLSPEVQEWVLSQAQELGLSAPNPAAEDPTVGRMVVKDFAQARILDRLLMYERRIEHSLYRTKGELRKQRLMREADPPKAAVVAEAVSVGCRVGLAPPRPGAEEESVGQAGSPNANDRVWEPDPPYNSPEEEVGRGRPTYERPPEGGTPNAAPAETPHHSNISSFQDSGHVTGVAGRPGAIAPNKPNLRPAKLEKGGGKRARHERKPLVIPRRWGPLTWPNASLRLDRTRYP